MNSACLLQNMLLVLRTSPQAASRQTQVPDIPDE